MRILHVTDSHGTVKNPEGRKDVYYISFLKKLYELGVVCKKANINMVIHTGDLFHTARVSNKFAGQIAEIIKAMQVPFYVVPGNHDIQGYNKDTIDQTTLGLLNKAGVVKILDRDSPIVINETIDNELITIGISGQEYYANIDSGNYNDFSMQQPLQDINVLCYHGYIADTPQHPSIRCTMVQDVNTDADIILTGHYHRSFVYETDDISIYNPGSMMRVEQTEYNKTFQPQYGILNISLDSSKDIVYDYKLYRFTIAQPSSVVFDYNTKYKQKIASITLEGFQNSLINTMQIKPSINLHNIIADVCTKQNVNKEVYHEAINKYNMAMQVAPETFNAPQGYIEDINKKTIQCVDIKNFQSHENTHIDFDKGLNIIIGESNHGKTSIIRAMMWAIDNIPQGNSFIMAGKTDCSVKIIYSDGTYIERSRTQTDAGYYNIRYKDITGAFKDVNYKGFANNIPIEVLNVHQMPKVSITKDIETHLNTLLQLDSPFLLTESTQTKASAIGRITGTHLIDAAIKEIARDIRANNVVIKDAEKDRKAYQVEISKLPDIALMKKIHQGYSDIIQYLDNSKVTEIADSLKIIQDYDKLCKETEDILQQYNNILALKEVCALASNIYANCKGMYGLLAEYDNISTQINANQDIIHKGKAISMFTPIVNYAVQKSNLVTELQDKLSQYELHNTQINVTEKEIQLKQQAVKIYADINVYLSQHITTVEQISQSLKEEMQLQNTIENTQTTLRTNKKYVKALNIQVDEVSSAIINCIMEKGICPCCGKPFQSTDTAKQIQKFMEEHVNG